MNERVAGVKESATGLGIVRPHLITWILVLGGMTLTGVLAYSTAAYQWWYESVTTLLTVGTLRVIFIVAVALHVIEAVAAYLLAMKSGRGETALGWAFQTFLMGYFSLGLLRRQIRRGA